MGSRLRLALAACASLMLTSCHDSLPSAKASEERNPEDGGASTGEAHRTSLTVTFSCSNGGAISMPVWACIASDKFNGAAGSLKIKSGGIATQYSESQIINTFPRPDIKMEMTAPFEIMAQSNSDENMVLHIEIRDGQKLVFQDEASGFGVIGVDSDNLA